MLDGINRRSGFGLKAGSAMEKCDGRLAGEEIV
jgi:hypothetical protein